MAKERKELGHHAFNVHAVRSSSSWNLYRKVLWLHKVAQTLYHWIAHLHSLRGDHFSLSRCLQVLPRQHRKKIDYLVFSPSLPIFCAVKNTDLMNPLSCSQALQRRLHALHTPGASLDWLKPVEVILSPASMTNWAQTLSYILRIQCTTRWLLLIQYCIVESCWEKILSILPHTQKVNYVRWWIWSWESFHDVYVYEIITLYPLNIYYYIHQLFLNQVWGEINKPNFWKSEGAVILANKDKNSL